MKTNNTMDFNTTQKVGKSQSESFNTSTDKEDSRITARRISQLVWVNAERLIEKDIEKILISPTWRFKTVLMCSK